MTRTVYFVVESTLPTEALVRSLVQSISVNEDFNLVEVGCDDEESAT